VKRTESHRKSKRLQASTSWPLSREVDEELRIIADRRESDAGAAPRAA
jgi:hypothetical protein